MMFTTAKAEKKHENIFWHGKQNKPVNLALPSEFLHHSFAITQIIAPDEKE